MNENLIYNAIEIKKIEPVDPDNETFKKDSILVSAVGLVEKFVPLSVMEKTYETYRNKEVRFDHELPEKNVKNLIGHIHDVFMENNAINYVFEVWGYREDLKEIQDAIMNNKMSISAGYKVTKNSDGDIIDMYGRELSVTPMPRCTAEDGCGITSAIVMNNNPSENNMTDDEKNAESLVILKETLIKQNESQGKEIVALNETINGLNAKFAESNETIDELSKKNELLQDEITVLKKQVEESVTLSLRKEYVQLLGITDEKAVNEKLEKLKKYEAEDLQEFIDDLSATAKRTEKITRTTGSNAPVTKSTGEQITENSVQNMSGDQLTASLYPDLAEKIAKNSKSKGRVPYPFGMDIGENDPVPVVDDSGNPI
jgi:hypothetical protein